MLLHFTKMHGLGNDFVLVDATQGSLQLTRQQVRHLANRRRGIGCDQVLLVEAARNDDTDFFYRIFNADGSEVEQCGNGARCLGRFVRDKGLTDRDELRVETRARILDLHLHADGLVTVAMGVPDFAPGAIPFAADAEAPSYDLRVGGNSITIGAVSIGNPHAVVRVDDLDRAPVSTLGPDIESHERFPARVNAGFMQIVDQNHIRLRVYERGSGETEACGSGACAAVAVGRRQGLLDSRVSVDLPGGRLEVQWDGEGTPVLLTGPVERVFEGHIIL